MSDDFVSPFEVATSQSSPRKASRLAAALLLGGLTSASSSPIASRGPFASAPATLAKPGRGNSLNSSYDSLLASTINVSEDTTNNKEVAESPTLSLHFQVVVFHQSDCAAMT